MDTSGESEQLVSRMSQRRGVAGLNNDPAVRHMRDAHLPTFIDAPLRALQRGRRTTVGEMQLRFYRNGGAKAHKLSHVGVQARFVTEQLRCVRIRDTISSYSANVLCCSGLH